MATTVTVSGPLFDGGADGIIDRMCRDIEQAVADEGEQMVRAELPRVLQNPTGRYQSGITTEPAGAGIDVTDGGIIYGPWLEGVGSRNAPTTRFAGYSTFRRTAQALDARAERIAEPIVARTVRSLG